MSFKDRKDAAEQLGKRLEDWSKLRNNRTIEEQQNSDAVIILAIPRGGVIIGDVITSILDDTKLDIIVSRKIRAPDNPELAIGAVLPDGRYFLNEDIVSMVSAPWNNEPYPDHTWISRTFKKIPLIYLECVLIWSAYLCLKESDWRRKGILASDSTSVETDRYAYEVRPAKSKRKFEKIRIKQYLKWHITAILDHLIILSTRLTSKKTHDLFSSTSNNVKQVEEIWG